MNIVYFERRLSDELRMVDEAKTIYARLAHEGLVKAYRSRLALLHEKRHMMAGSPVDDTAILAKA
jgi:hypothetical protein